MHTETTRETRIESGEQSHNDARNLLMAGGDSLQKEGFKLLGGVALYFYVSKFSQDVQFQVLPVLRGVPEPLAVEGAREITRVMMKEYGHAEPKKRGK